MMIMMMTTIIMIMAAMTTMIRMMTISHKISKLGRHIYGESEDKSTKN